MVTSHAPPTVAVHQDASEGIDGKGNNPGETSEAAKQGRSFDVKVSPRETWDAVFETVIGEIRAEGHGNLLVNLKKKVSLKTCPSASRMIEFWWPSYVSSLVKIRHV